MLSDFAPQPDYRKYYPSKGNCLKRFTYLARKKTFPCKAPHFAEKPQKGSVKIVSRMRHFASYPKNIRGNP